MKKNINKILIVFILFAALIYYIKSQSIKEGVGASDIIDSMRGFSDYMREAKNLVGVIEKPLLKQGKRFAGMAQKATSKIKNKNK